MALLKLQIKPLAEGYQATPAAQVVSVQLDGGAPRERADVIGAWAKVPVRWMVGASGYEYLQAFHSLTGAKGLPFLADLILESAHPAERTVRFVPGSFGLIAKSGPLYTVAAELAVEPAPIDDELAATIVDLFEDPFLDGPALDGVIT